MFKPPFSDTSRPVATWTVDLNQDADYVSVDARDNVLVSSQGIIFVFKHGLKSQGNIWKTIQTPKNTGFYDVAASPMSGDIYVAMVNGNGSQPVNAVGVIPPHSWSFDDARYITSSSFIEPPSEVAVGI